MQQSLETIHGHGNTSIISVELKWVFTKKKLTWMEGQTALL